MVLVPGAHTPESSSGLPIWLIAVWSPNMAAIIIWTTQKIFVGQIQWAFSFPKISWWTLLIFIPLAIAAVLLKLEALQGSKIQWSNFKIDYVIPLLLINLFMGPLGEELGWRAFLYPIVKSQYGWLASALIVGIIWAFWHAPLWLIDSPQSKIPFWAFTINVMCLSILMSIVYNHSGGSIIPVVLFHLIFNLSLGVIDILESHAPGEYVEKSLFVYIPVTALFMGLHELVDRTECTL